jgi:chromosome segregation ATPase
MEQSSSLTVVVEAPEPASEGALVFWQERCLRAQREITALLKHIQQLDARATSDEQQLNEQAVCIVKLNRSLSTARDNDAWLRVVRKHLNAQDPVALDQELKALTRMFRDRTDEIACLQRQIMSLEVQLSEFKNPDNTPLI